MSTEPQLKELIEVAKLTQKALAEHDPLCDTEGVCLLCEVKRELDRLLPPDDQAPEYPSSANVYGLICEYQDIKELDEIDMVDAIMRHDWSSKAAAILMSLAERYGSFILRSALAIAIVRGIEDGSEGL